MNKVILIGRTTAKPELKATQSGTKVCKFTLAVNREFKNMDGKYDTDFIDCITFNNADTVAQYVDKGDLIAVRGRIQKSSYTNQNGEKRYVTNVVTDRVEFLQMKKKETQTVEEPVEDPFSSFGEEIAVDDNFLDD